MARIRSIKPDFWTDEKIVELDFADRLLFIGLWNFCDDHGYFNYRPKRIKMQVFPGDDYNVVEGLRRLFDSSLLALYGTSEGVVGHVRGWTKHQRVSNPTKERFQPSDLHEYADFDEAVQNPREESRVLGKGREGKGSTSTSEIADAIPDPDRPEVMALCERLAKAIEANGLPKPTYGKTWLTAARLLIDKDGFTVHQIEWMIDWASNDEFWRSNILSMPKLREKFPQLKLKAVPETAAAPKKDPLWMLR